MDTFRRPVHAKGRPMSTSVRTALVPAVALACGLALAVTPATPGAAATVPPGAPGQPAVWTPADKHGFGTSTTVASPVWYTLGHGALCRPVRSHARSLCR